MSLKYLFEQPNLNTRKARWIDFISEYDFDVNHIKGRENKISYTLIGKVHLLINFVDIKSIRLVTMCTYQGKNKHAQIGKMQQIGPKIFWTV